MIPITRKEAASQGLSRYFTNVPCKNGHLVERLVVSKNCVLCRVAWRKQYKEWSRPATKLYRAEHAANINEDRKRRRKHDTSFIEWQRKYYADNRGTINSKRRIYREKSKSRINRIHSEWLKNNPEKSKEYKDQDYFLHKSRYINSARNRQRRIASASGTHTINDIRSIFRSQREKCAYCRVKLGTKFHVDHIVPIIRGGSNERRNLQILCAPCNLKKGARDPIQFSQSLGMLL